jgi:hypothetical protein
MASKIRDAELLVLEDAGHMAFIEEHEVFNAALADFARRALARPQRRLSGGRLRRGSGRAAAGGAPRASRDAPGTP